MVSNIEKLPILIQFQWVQMSIMQHWAKTISMTWSSMWEREGTSWSWSPLPWIPVTLVMDYGIANWVNGTRNRLVDSWTAPGLPWGIPIPLFSTGVVLKVRSYGELISDPGRFIQKEYGWLRNTPRSKTNTEFSMMLKTRFLPTRFMIMAPSAGSTWIGMLIRGFTSQHWRLPVGKSKTKIPLKIGRSPRKNTMTIRPSTPL